MHARTVYSAERPRGGEREVRRLLRGLHRPHILHSEPLARTLCDIYGISRPFDAVLRLVDDTFAEQQGSAGPPLRELIQRCDIDGCTQAGTALAMNISARQFFRYRSEAVKALVRQVHSLVGERPSEQSPLQEVASLLADVDPSAAADIYNFFPRSKETTYKRIETALCAGDTIDDATLENCMITERAPAYFAIARFLYEGGEREHGNALMKWTLQSIRDGHLPNRIEIEFQSRLTQYVEAVLFLDTDTAEARAREVRRTAGGSEWANCTALLLEIEAAVRLGDIPRAQESYEIAKGAILALSNLRLLGGLLYCEALIAFMNGNLEAAEAALRGALLALRHRPNDAMALHALNGRIKLQMGRPWIVPAQLSTDRPGAEISISLPGSAQKIALNGKSDTCFAQLSLEGAQLRSALFRNSSIDPDLFDDYIVRARSAGYPAIVASALSLAASARERRQDSERAQQLYRDAWAIYVELRDEVLGRDLIIFDAAPLRDLGPLKLEPAFLKILDESIAARFPASVFAQFNLSIETRSFWYAAIRTAYLQAEHEHLKRVQAEFVELLRPHVKFEHLRHRRSMRSEVPLRLAVFVPLPMRSGFQSALSKILEHFYDTLEKTIIRKNNGQAIRH